MPPPLALLLWLILLLALWRFDPAKDPETSAALWVPLVWMFIIGSRQPSQWLSGQVGSGAEAIEEGNPLNAGIFLVLILLAIGILMSRSFKWGDFFGRNLALIVFLSYALLSVLWSDFPFVAFKRWFRELGSYLMVLVPLSDPHPLEAVSTLLRRLGYLLIPLCILLIKYYPDISRDYDPWSGQVEYVGATTGKNLLGVVALISGLFFFWDTVRRWADRKERCTRRVILVNLAFIAMTLWVLDKSSSATCRVCLALGCLVIAVAHRRAVKRHPGRLTVLIPVVICIYLVLAFGFGIDFSTQMAGAVGRDPTLTGRTKIWSVLLSMHTDPLIGTGYESFWMGSRLRWLWENPVVHGINEAHNGYLEVYLNLGIIGVSLLGVFLISSYRTICRRLVPFSSFGSLSLALWLVLLVRSMTEASFRGGLMWVTFLSGALAVPQHSEDRVYSVTAFDNAEGSQQFPVIS
jgi:O-antigen ligase